MGTFEPQDMFRPLRKRRAAPRAATASMTTSNCIDLRLKGRGALWAATLAAALALGACGGGGGSAPAPAPAPEPSTPKPPPQPPAPVANVETALRQLTDQVLVRAVGDFRAQARTIAEASAAFCASGTGSVKALQDHWKSLYERWFALANYVFGPLSDNIVTPQFIFIDGLRLRGTDYTNTVRDEIAADIARTSTLDKAYFDAKTFQRVGLLALEVALFETATGERSPELANIAAEFAATPRKCAVLTGLAQSLSGRAQYVQDGWLRRHRNAEKPYRELFLAGQLDEGREPLAQLIIGAQAHLEYLQARQVAVVGAQRSGHVWQALGAAIDSLEALLGGAGDSTVSLFDVMKQRGEGAVVDKVGETIAAIRAAIRSEDPTMLEIRLGQLDGNFKREIADGLGVKLGITFADGD